jgi:hypothetical protein
MRPGNQVWIWEGGGLTGAGRVCSRCASAITEALIDSRRLVVRISTTTNQAASLSGVVNLAPGRLFASGARPTRTVQLARKFGHDEAAEV